ncbi:beta-lactamase family protein [Spiractinospora alimapuensis]|uniref:serine hydrolase domain-containing protein n=1 Tax=Spiractinospora alimapuensis TaxID=2820884 RepID=UPI001F3B14FD|nr:serine hydrolase domain-containing protein [Spiractinospora alimapuensis]QVQ51571.1 beta-lactamase family protein [Spiractinospora alimapuensis]
MARRWVTTGAVVVLVCATFTTPAHAEPQAERVDPEEVRAFIDARLPELMAEQGIPGATVSVVQHGEPVLATGYGDPALDSDTPVDAEETAFHTGSVGKSFTAAAALQLVADGAIDPHTDVNTYLPEPAHVPDTYPGQPVTLHHLLTHTAGFEEHREGSVAEDPDDALPLREYVPRAMPERVYPPGRYDAYSNFGYTLVGYLIEEVSGQPFPEYVDDAVFTPLGMDSTSFQVRQEDLPSGQAVTTNYMITPAGDLFEGPPMTANESPGGFAYSTGPDMARFMRALLDEGRVDGEQALAPETVTMLDRQAETHPDVAAMGYGTYDRYTSDPRVVGAFGNLMGANAEYALVPERNLGVFVAVNSDSTEGLGDAAWTRFVDEFLVEFADVERGPDATERVPMSQEELARYDGGYHAGRVSFSETSTLMAILGSYRPARVEEGALRMSCSSAMEEQLWYPVGDGLFHSADGQEWAGFIEDDGDVVGFVCDQVPMHPYVRADWWQTPFPYLTAAALSVALLLSMLAWPIASLTRRLRGRTRPRVSRGARDARRLAVATGVATGAALVTLVVLLLSPDMGLMAFTGEARIAGTPLAVVSPLVAGVVVAAVFSWTRRWWGVTARLHYSLIAAALVVVLLVAHHFNLVWTPW